MDTSNLIQELQLAKNNGYNVRAKEVSISNQRKEIIITITKKKSFQDCCKEFYNTHKEIFRNPNIKFFSRENYTFCIYKNKVYYAKKHKDDPFVPSVGQVAAWARAIETDINKMVGYVP